LSKRLPILSGKEIIKALAKVGFVPVREKGSNVFLVFCEKMPN
jgi:predicted RNA binding protein YcfA (HicA-like mRNA interferase family)